MSIISGIVLESNKNIHVNFEGGKQQETNSSRRQTLIRWRSASYERIFQ